MQGLQVAAAAGAELAGTPILMYVTSAAVAAVMAVVPRAVELQG
jgi:hypothetical protein